MAWPRQVNPKSEIALAPYNFVPLPEKVVTRSIDDLPDQHGYGVDLRSGRLIVTLTTEAPLYVRCALTPEEAAREEEARRDGHKGDAKPDFFYADPGKMPRIPGSSIRGMLRTLVEIVSYSKMEGVADSPLVYRAVGDTTSHGRAYRDRIMAQGPDDRHWIPKVQAGYMRRSDSGDWQIQPAEMIEGTSFARIRLTDIPADLPSLPNREGCRNARRIYFQPGPFEYQDVKGDFLKIKFSRVTMASAPLLPDLLTGALVRSGPMISKRSEAVIYAESDPSAVAALQLSYDLVTAYKEQISPEQAELLGEDGVLKVGQPVFYLLEQGRVVAFGHTMMMRLPYEHTPFDLIPGAIRDTRSRREKRRTQAATSTAARLDVAESIFGYTRATGEGKARAYASRLFVGDAILAPGQANPWLVGEEGLTPKILGSPKPTTFQHYLVQEHPDPQQQGVTRDRRPKYLKFLVDYDERKSPTVLRGHKLYWHKESPQSLDFVETNQGKIKKAPKQYTRIRPVRPGVSFVATLYFENLHDEELGAILWALTLPGSAQYRHKLGMGKPYGLGSVHLETRLELDDRRQRYTTLLHGDSWSEARQQADSDIPALIQSFERLMQNALGTPEGTPLAKLERIAMLLTLLEWPGPPNEQTRYLEIERSDPASPRGKINEYKSRPVLPDPLAVVGERRPGPVRGQAQPPVTPGPAAPAPAEVAPPPPAPPAAPPEVRRGIIVEIRPDKRRGRVRDVETGQEYSFDTTVIQGNTPAKRGAVEFDLQAGRVTRVQRL